MRVTTVAWKTPCSDSGDRPWWRRVRSANSDFAQVRRVRSMCWVMEKRLLRVTPRIVIESTRGIFWTAGLGIATSLRLFGGTKAISSHFK